MQEISKTLDQNKLRQANNTQLSSVIPDCVLNIASLTNAHVPSQTTSLSGCDLSSHSHYLRSPALSRHMVRDDRDSRWEHSLSRHMLSVSFLTLTESTLSELQYVLITKTMPRLCWTICYIQKIRINVLLWLHYLLIDRGPIQLVLTGMDLLGQSVKLCPHSQKKHWM